MLVVLKNVAASSAGKAKSYLARFRGLMLRRRLDPGEALIIEPCSSIHMMFMLFAIDAVFLDKEMKIVSIAHDLKPWRFAGARKAKSEGVPVVLDSGSWKAGMADLLRHVDIVVCSADYHPPGCRDNRS